MTKERRDDSSNLNDPFFKTDHLNFNEFNIKWDKIKRLESEN